MIAVGHAEDVARTKRAACLDLLDDHSLPEQRVALALFPAKLPRTADRKGARYSGSM